MFVPGRVILRRNKKTGELNVNLLGTSPEKILENAILAAKSLNDAGLSSLVPYSVAGGRLNDAGAAALARDLQTYSDNHAHGYMGSGRAIVRPEKYQGYIPAEDASYTPKPLDQAKADFINLLMGFEPPKSTKKGHARFDKSGMPILNPANVEAQILVEAQGGKFVGSVRIQPAKFADQEARFAQRKSVV